MVDVQRVRSARLLAVRAAAGCGKTRLISSAVAEGAGERSLVLTHTHAGVDALRRRIRSLGGKTQACTIATIAGWALNLARRFPGTCGPVPARPTDSEWVPVYEGATRLVSISAIARVVRSSYDAVYVDEYQDCNRKQHALVVALSRVLPVRVFGDPLQGIFDFDRTLVDWDSDVTPVFGAPEELRVPHRWQGGNRALGAWLCEARTRLERGDSLDLRRAPRDALTFVPLGTNPALVQRAACSRARCADGESLVAIHQWEGQCHKVAQQTGGKFRSLETLECAPLFEYGRRLDQAVGGQALAKVALDFAVTCLIGIDASMRDQAARAISGAGGLGHRQTRFARQLAGLRKIAASGRLEDVRSWLAELLALGQRARRFELFAEMQRALDEALSIAPQGSVEEAAGVVRDRTRRMGRRLPRYVVSRTLLVKGLEFDHALILDASVLDRRNLYVALTRASRSLTVLSRKAVVP